jgi:hypothetical protein
MYKRREYKVLHGDGDDSSSSDSESGEERLQGGARPHLVHPQGVTAASTDAAPPERETPAGSGGDDPSESEPDDFVGRANGGRLGPSLRPGSPATSAPLMFLGMLCSAPRRHIRRGGG